MAPTAVTSPSSPSAAARVFAVPELLENILLHLADDVSSSRWGGNLEPVPTLSRCQAVNRVFNETVRGSVKLQRLLVSPAARESESRDEPALRWLFLTRREVDLSKKEFSQKHADGQPLKVRYMIRFGEHDLLPAVVSEGSHSSPTLVFARAGLFEAFLRDFGDPKASWRRVRMRHEKDSIKISYSGTRCYDKHTSMKVDFRSHRTLGEVFNSYCEFLRQVLEDQEAVAMEGRM